MMMSLLFLIHPFLYDYINLFDVAMRHLLKRTNKCPFHFSLPFCDFNFLENLSIKTNDYEIRMIKERIVMAVQLGEKHYQLIFMKDD